MVKKELYVFLYILVGLVHGAALTYTISVISTVERRLGLDSRLTGSLLAGHDMSQVVFSLILNYHGRCSHRLRWIGVGMVFVVAACLSAAIPHLLFGFGRDGFGAELAGFVGNGTMAIAENTRDLCFFVGDENCGSDVTAEALLGTVLLLFISQFFMGIAVTIFYTVGVTYVEHNIDRRTFPLYYGVTLLLRVLGPVLGYLLGSLFFKAWIDPAKTPSRTYKNSELLDVWWTGSLCILCGLAVSGSLSFLFPRRAPESFRQRIRKILAKEKVEEEASPAESKAKESQIKQSLKEAWESARRIFTNKIWVLNLFNTTLFALAVSGYWSLRPKYLESQFRKRSIDANFYIGLSSLLSPMFGMGLSGVILLWMRPKVKVLMAYSVFVTLCGGAAYVGLIFAGCPKLDIVGPVAGSLTPPCSADCGCSGRFSPMCSEDQITLFYSPCYAGCTVASTANSTVGRELLGYRLLHHRALTPTFTTTLITSPCTTTSRPTHFTPTLTITYQPTHSAINLSTPPLTKLALNHTHLHHTPSLTNTFNDHLSATNLRTTPTSIHHSPLTRDNQNDYAAGSQLTAIAPGRRTRDA
nr:solute carrier organic anion transporter family member 3A1-like [Penaeus vannamei]